ncbi:MAG: symmetrical bis(5'-nucleosyl)-tetraphosphatase [Burkholderiales bacterium]
MVYLIGDVQGCCGALQRMLDTLAFSPSRDHVVMLGDLVNRGPDSLGTLRLLRGLGDAATCLLGNHDLHFLAAAHGIRKTHRSDTLDGLLNAPDREAWVDWVRQRRMALHDHGWLMVHAGVPPQWTLATTLRLAAEVEEQLRGPDLNAFLAVMYGNQPDRWRDALQGADRLRFAINALTRTRFVAADGTLDFATKEGAGKAPPGLLPWFEHPQRQTQGVPMAFGHWSTLGLIQRPDLLSLDTGCIWGGKLSAAHIAPDGSTEIIQIDCEQAQRPG